MKTVIVILLLAYGFSLHAQWYNRYYPGKQLEDLSKTELSLLYEKSAALKKTGVTLAISGYVVAGIGGATIMFAGLIDILAYLGGGEYVFSDTFYKTFIAVAITGLAISVVGVPIWITGSSRNKAVRERINFLVSDSSIALAPAIVFGRTQSRYTPGPGISFTVRF